MQACLGEIMAHKPNGNGGKKPKAWPKYGVLSKDADANGKSIVLSNTGDDSTLVDTAAAQLVATGVEAIAVGLHPRKPRKIKVHRPPSPPHQK